MKRQWLLLFFLGLIMSACNNPVENKKQAEPENPFFVEYNTPFEVPAFDKIKVEHFMPAFTEGMKLQQEEISAIINNADAPDFVNTIEAMEYSGALLTKVSDVFYNYTSSNISEEIQAIAKEVSPLLSKHRDDIALNADLFKRIKVVFDQMDNLGLNTEQQKLLEKKYKSFVRGGANLNETDQARFREINKEQSALALQFGENQLAEVNNYKMILENEEDLAGLPQSIIDGAAIAAKEDSLEGKWLFTLAKPSFIPFLIYSEKRELREKILKAYNNIGNNNNANDNKEIVAKTANLRVERAKLLGYETHSHFILEENMAKEPANVYGLLSKIWSPALELAKKEVKELQAVIDAEGGNFKLEAWDWWHYAEKLRKAKYDLDEEMLRPYFELTKVRQGAFDVANKLYGISFEERTDLPVYHNEATAYEVKEADGSHIGILYMDWHPRKSKRSGAWMSSYRKQSRKDGKNVSPVITVVCNFSKPTADKPSLLTFDEVSTLFHEFGHALHGLLSDCTYPSISGTAVPRDFVELPSQVMENWCAEPEVLKMFAYHYKTGELIPDELLEKVEKSSHFNQGFTTVEFMSAAYLDMAYHTLSDKVEIDVNKFENDAMTKLGLIPEIVVRYRSTYFAHIFSGGYSSGYYAYLWSEYLDADAFEAFKETELFSQETASKFRDFVISQGGTDDPMKMYKKFRGKEPVYEPLLKRKGLL